MSTETKAVTHTPGPWWLDGLIVRPNSDMTRRRAAVADCAMSHGLGDAGLADAANARLIAAAPDLFAACRAVAGVFEGQEDAPLYAQKCRAAIAKAEGR